MKKNLQVNNESALEISVIGNFVFVLFYSGYIVQKHLAKLFFTLFIKPALFVGKILDEDKKRPIEQRSTDENHIILDLLRSSHLTLWKYLQNGFRINALLSGTRSRFDIYEHLLNWDTKIPVIGFKEEKTTYTIQPLFKKNKDGSRGTDFVWLSTHLINGKFKILSKQRHQDKIQMEAVWLTGEERGKVFSITRYGVQDLLDNNFSQTPSAFYYPPRFAILIVEILVSATAIIAFLQITKESWKVLIPFLKETFAMFTSFIIGS